MLDCGLSKIMTFPLNGIQISLRSQTGQDEEAKYHLEVNRRSVMGTELRERFQVCKLRLLCECVCQHVHGCTYLYTCMHMSACACMCMLHMCVCMYVCRYVCIYTYMCHCASMEVRRQVLSCGYVTEEWGGQNSCLWSQWILICSLSNLASLRNVILL